MAPPGVVEPIDVLEYCGFSLTPRWPALPPDEFCFDGFKECLDRGIVVAVAFTAHGRCQPVLLQLLLIIISTILQTSLRSLHRFDCCHDLSERCSPCGGLRRRTAISSAWEWPDPSSCDHLRPSQRCGDCADRGSPQNKANLGWSRYIAFHI
jgi:hypothetical protein